MPSAEHLLQLLESRFAARPLPGIAWTGIRTRLEADPRALRTLQAMQDSGGEPALLELEPGRLACVDCSAESPSGRRSLCYDRQALDARKENRPAGSALEMAAALGVELLSADQYRALQRHGEFDTKTSSWVATPAEIRAAGGALFGDRRYGATFIYHNGAQSYYAARGFRGLFWL